ncbi:flagellar hook-length control protein FliK [Alkalispirillum mobile]|uniref:Flagellar hook-length control protein FliK n=1 Tax=Alkalispirillum mobile TaxID=85925 RepID=A0A498C6H8_9GAMM|nr:flagellar hook-length control protein FliK [Alkalispirillum mobile]RLK50669.1 flagellar hook-length control protein FliK [Alkalispirillum mobile]
MKITHTTPTLEIRGANIARPALALRLDQVLQATVRTGPDGRMALEMANHLLGARSEIPLREGDRLTLQVAELQPRVNLKVLEHRGREPAINNALRTLLPQQGTLTPLLEQLGNLARTGVESSQRAALPAPVREAVLAVLASTPSAEQASRPEGLREALQRSGLLLESRLAALLQGPAPQQAGSAGAQLLNQDLKAALLRLAARIRQHAAGGAQAQSGQPQGTGAGQESAAGRAAPLPTGMPADGLLALLLRQTESALARLQLLQVQTAALEQRLDFTIDLPLKHGEDLDLVRMRVREDEAGGSGDEEDAGRSLELRLGFDFRATGPLDAIIRLRGETVSVAWWAERPPTVAVLDELLPHLESRLRAQGFELGYVVCQQGQPPQAPDAYSGERRPLLDLKA